MTFTFELPTAAGWYFVVRPTETDPTGYDVIEVRDGDTLATRPYLEAWQFAGRGLFVDLHANEPPERWAPLTEWLGRNEPVMFAGPIPEPPFPETALRPYREGDQP